MLGGVKLEEIRLQAAARLTRDRKHMASSLLALLDDIATILDDVSMLTKVAAKKTAGVLGDDLALNAQQVTGVAAERELPVVWAVAKGSFINKAILVPAALAISAFAPWAVTPLLMLGGAFLCFEGFEKLAHKFLHSRAEDEAHARGAGRRRWLNPAVDLVALEKDKIKGAMRTDFILSAEIIVITLGTVAQSEFIMQVAVLAGIAIVMTVGRVRPGGGHRQARRLRPLPQPAAAAPPRAASVPRILRAAPWLMKGLSVAGTAAMFLVGGGILAHGIAPLHHAIEHWTEGMGGTGVVVAHGARRTGGHPRRRPRAGRRHSRPASRAPQSRRRERRSDSAVDAGRGAAHAPVGDPRQALRRPSACRSWTTP